MFPGDPDKSRRFPSPTISPFSPRRSMPSGGPPKTGPAQPPPLRPRTATPSYGGLGTGAQLPSLGFGVGLGVLPPGSIRPAAPGVPPMSAEAQRLLAVGSAQQALAARASKAWTDRIALSDAQEVFKNMNAGYAQALYAAELWALRNQPAEPAAWPSWGYGGFGGRGGRGYAFALGLYDWRVGG